MIYVAPERIAVALTTPLPALGWRPSAPCHVFGDGGLTNVDAELEKFAMDPGSAPERVG